MQGELLLLLAIHLALTGLPGIAVAVFAASRGERREPVLLATFLAASGAAAMLAFWAYYGEHEIGQTVSFFLVFGSVLLAAWSLYDGDIERQLLRRLSVPLALWAFGSAFIVFLGFAHGGTDQAVFVSGNRFSSPLPSDNDIPHFFSDWFFTHGHDGTPPEFLDWLSSDRPPLQTAYANFERTFAWDNIGLHYEVLGVVLQQLWIVGLWALLSAAKVGRWTKLLVMLTVVVSNVAIVNGFYVWPKMLPAGLLLGAAALTLTPLWSELKRQWLGAVLVGALFGLAMLGHGASAFGILPLALVAAWRGLPSWRWLGVLLLAGAVFVLPWSAYQSYGDPPGNRLTKWFLGGFNEKDDRGTVETIIDGYSEAGVVGTLHKKGQNFVAIFGGGAMTQNLRTAWFALTDGDLETVVRSIRTIFFFNLVPSLGLLLAGPVAMALRYRSRDRRGASDWTLAASLLLAFAVGTIAWALIQFGGWTAQTVIHQGSLLLPLLGICGCAVGLCAAYPRFARWYLAFNAALMLALYVPVLEPHENTSWEPLSLLLAALFLIAFVALSWTGSRSSPRRSFARSPMPSPPRNPA